MTEMSRVERRKAQLRAEQQVAAAADEQIEYLEDSLPTRQSVKEERKKGRAGEGKNQNKNAAVHFSDRPVHYRNNRCLFRSSLYDEQQQI